MSLSIAISTNWVKEIRRKTFGMPPSEEKVRSVLSHERPSKNSSTGAQAKPPLINIAAFDWMSNQPQILRQIIQIYLEITPGTVEQINEGIAGGDSEQVAQAAHSLKGSSAELGAEQLANLCHQLYMQAKAENRGCADRLALEVSRCYRETSTALNALDLG